MPNYKLNTYADGFGRWHAQIFFTPPIGNTGEAEAIATNAIANAKRRIRRELLERSNGNLIRLSYRVSANKLLPSNHLASLTISEGPAYD